MEDEDPRVAGCGRDIPGECPPLPSIVEQREVIFIVSDEGLPAFGRQQELFIVRGALMSLVTGVDGTMPGLQQKLGQRSGDVVIQIEVGHSGYAAVLRRIRASISFRWRS